MVPYTTVANLPKGMFCRDSALKHVLSRLCLKACLSRPCHKTYFVVMRLQYRSRLPFRLHTCEMMGTFP